ncbi:hypothetical protein [Neisseria cinerea]|uniref:Uncharacterized protein n=1 Tax=Neisseria cinerea ATCC 14685 TaxID=546262 RepID=D0W575_NEICI|nr:hypothetical protein [Neisseria cinerea]EEZ71075.1 hypothetical protein NEICINOT_04825 [Neisseria cinerea ATCC 14685]
MSPYSNHQDFPISRSFDAALISAGSAESAASSLFRKKGCKACVLEQQHFPRLVIEKA